MDMLPIYAKCPALNLAPFSRWTLRDKAAPVSSTLNAWFSKA